MTQTFNAASLEVFLNACSTKDLRPLIKRHIPSMLNSPNSHQVPALVKRFAQRSRKKRMKSIPRCQTPPWLPKTIRYGTQPPQHKLSLFSNRGPGWRRPFVSHQWATIGSHPSIAQRHGQAVHTLADGWTP